MTKSTTIQQNDIDENTKGNIEFRPMGIYFFSKYFILICVLFILLVLCKNVHETSLQFALGIISVVLMLFIFFQYVSILLCTKWTITDKKIIIKKGVFIKTINDTELFRVIDFSEKRNIIQSIFKNTTLFIYSSDKTDPVLCLYGIRNDRDAIEEIKQRCKDERTSNGIKETNINNNGL